MATTLLTVYALCLFDALSRWHPHVELHVYVDDVDLYVAHTCPRQAADRLSGATRLLLQVFEGVLQMQVAYQKCVLLASSSNVDGHLRNNLRSTGIRLRSWGSGPCSGAGAACRLSSARRWPTSPLPNYCRWGYTCRIVCRQLLGIFPVGRDPAKAAFDHGCV